MADGRNLIALLAAMALCSCAPQPPTASDVPRFNRVALVTPADIPVLGRPKSESDYLEDYVYGGATIGTFGGAAIGSAICGPVLYGLCVATISWYGLVAGTAGGAAIGLYNFSGLSDTDAAYMAEVLSRIETNHALNNDLNMWVERQVPSEMIADPENADIQIVIQLNRIRFTEVEKEQISMHLDASLIFAWAGESTEQTSKRLFSVEAPTEDIDDLIANDGSLLEQLIEQCIKKLAAEMSSTVIALSGNRDGAS